MPYFSVVIPTYKRAHSIKRAIESILNQTFIDFEIIVVDDASPDNTEQVVQSIKDSRIVYLKNETNQERCVSRNRGVEVSKGKYICFLDSDDYHLSNHLQDLYDIIHKQEEPVAFFFTNSWNETEDGVRTERNCPLVEALETNDNMLTSRTSVNAITSVNEYTPVEALETEVDLYTYFLRYTVNPQRWCVHREIFQKIQFDPEVIICEDMDTSLRIVNAGYPVFQLDKRTTVYVAAADSFSHGDVQKWEKELFYLKRIFSKSELKRKLSKKEIKRLMSMCYFHLSNKYYKDSNRLKSITYAVKSFLLYPKGYNGKTNKILLNNVLKSIF